MRKEAPIRALVKENFCIETVPPPCGLIIFGASGDLTARKLIPALWSLFEKSHLRDNFFILGCARSEHTDDSFREKVREYLSDQSGSKRLSNFLDRCSYISGNYDDPALYTKLSERLQDLDKKFQTNRHRIFYLALPPTLYTTISDNLGTAGLAGSNPCLGELPDNRCEWVRLVVEKPFGRDLESSVELNRSLYRFFTERQIYRIDHYLGKETVQNMLCFRFANSIFEAFWNRDHIDNVQITVAESLGIGHRAGYFEEAGLLRDMFQNHILQMLTLVAMEPPLSFDDRFRDEKLRLLRSIRTFPENSLSDWIIRGQYRKGTVDGNPVREYLEEDGVNHDSKTETYVAARLLIDNWRWHGVPFYIRAGKRLNRKLSEIAITFKHVPHSMFAPINATDLPANVLVFNVQPDEGIMLTIQSKHPGPKLCMSSLTMDIDYRQVFGETPPEAYERLLLDCMIGDQTLFIREDAMEIAWRLFTPVLQAWQNESEPPPAPYPAGSWGPKEADMLLSHRNHRWRDI